jgi:hypothetical protein
MSQPTAVEKRVARSLTEIIRELERLEVLFPAPLSALDAGISSQIVAATQHLRAAKEACLSEG